MKLRYPALLALACTPFAQADIFISEYVEGSGVNKALEFFNPTDAPIDLAAGNYSISLFSNGASSASSTAALEGTIQPNGTFVIVSSNSDVNDVLENLADQESGTINHNGDDAYVLYKDGVAIDSFGDVGFDPGSRWDVNGVSTQNQTLRRLSTISEGDTLISDDFDPSAEWTEHSIDDFSDIGRHTFEGGDVVDTPPAILTISPVDGATFVGIDANIQVSFSEDVTVSAWNDVVCSISGNHSVSGALTGRSFTLDPDTDFVLDESCSFTIFAADVADIDETPLNLATDTTISFSTGVFPIVINEMLDDPANNLPGDANGDGIQNFSDDEFVELVNNSDSPVDITGWTIADGASTRHTFPEGTVVPAGCAVVVFGGGTPTGTFGGAVVQTASSGAVGLNNGGDTVTVSNGTASVVASYGSEGSDQSTTRSPDITGDFAQHTDVAGGTLYSPGTKLDGTIFDGCEVPDVAPFVAETSPENNATEVSASTSIEVTFSEAVEVSGFADLACSVSGDVALEVTPDGLTYSLQPTTTLAAGDSCTLTIAAESVVDLDGESNTMAEDFVLSFSTVSELLACDSSFTLISAIQGSGSSSPLAGQSHSVQAIVTSIAPELDGFFVQEEAADNDADPLSSEGLFIYNEAGFDVPAAGAVVALKGDVAEFFSKTQMTLTEAPVVCGEAVANSAPLSMPLPADFDYEPLEGMLVSFDQELTVTNTFELGRRGRIELSSQLLYNPTNLFLPGSAEAIAMAEVNARDSFLLDDGSDDQNRDVVPYPTGGLSAANTLRIGDSVSGVVGIVDYRFSTFMVTPVVEPIFSANNIRPVSPELVEGNLKVASFNVLNYFNGDGQGSGFPTSRGAYTAEDLERQSAKLVAAFIEMDADIVGVIEIENDGFGAESAIQELVDRLNAEFGEGTYVFVDPGVSQIGTDEIMVGFIYKPATVSLVGAAKILDSSNSITDDSGAPLFLDGSNRPALAQEFSLNDNGESVVVTVNHFKSKGSDCDSLGDPDVGDGQGNCNVTRTNAATALLAFLDTEFAGKPTLIIGDLNSYAKEDPITEITDAGYTNLVSEFGGELAYGYTFGGEVGYLDHALANEALADSVVDTTEWGINAAEPLALDYTTRFKTDFNDVNFFAPDPYRSSDHDPVLISLNLEAAGPLPGDWDGDGDVDINDVRALQIAWLTRQSIDPSFDFNGDGQINFFDIRALFGMCTRTRCAP